MAILPDFTYGTITGRVLAARLPEIVGGGPVAGVFPLARVNLKATRPPWIQVKTGDKALVMLPEYRLHMTAEGELKNPVTGEPDAEVIATDDPLAGPFAWHVTVEVPGRVKKFEGYLEVPAGTTADLADAAVADPSGPNTPEWVKLRAEILATLDELPGKATDAIEDAVVEWTESLSATAALTVGASAGTVTVEKVGTRVVGAVTGLTKAGTVEHVATLPAGFAPAHAQGHGWLVDAAGAWWPAHVTPTQLVVLGPPPAGTVLNGSLTWKAAS